jgi:Recombination endonuclease VII
MLERCKRGHDLTAPGAVIWNGWKGGRRQHTCARCKHLRQMWDRYGIVPSDFSARIIAQGGLCAICQCQLTDPHIDHDHQTGRVRGILCTHCNTALGLLGENPDRLRAAIFYLAGDQ